MAVELVPAKPEHVPELGRIVYEAFKDIADRHGFPTDFPSARVGRAAAGMLVQREEIYGVAALMGGQPVGSNFLLTSDEVAGLGPISVEVPLQGRSIGRALMENVIDYARQNNIEQVRLVQDSFNVSALSLYASLGFDVKEACALMQPAPAEDADPSVRLLTEADLPAIDEISRRIYKVSRRNEVGAAIQGAFSRVPPLLRERDGRVSGYYILGFAGHGVAETEEDALALVGQAAKGAPPGAARVLCPLSAGSLYRRFLGAGFRTIKVMNLMALGSCEPPDGVWLPSTWY